MTGVGFEASPPPLRAAVTRIPPPHRAPAHGRRNRRPL